jgi:hypothetical protein
MQIKCLINREPLQHLEFGNVENTRFEHNIQTMLKKVSS